MEWTPQYRPQEWVETEYMKYKRILTDESHFTMAQKLRLFRALGKHLGYEIKGE